MSLCNRFESHSKWSSFRVRKEIMGLHKKQILWLTFKGLGCCSSTNNLDCVLRLGTTCSISFVSISCNFWAFFTEAFSESMWTSRTGLSLSQWFFFGNFINSGKRVFQKSHFWFSSSVNRIKPDLRVVIIAMRCI